MSERLFRSTQLKGTMVFALIALSSALFSCTSMIFQPSRSFYFEPRKFGIDYDIVRFQSKDGTPLVGWHMKRRDPSTPSKGMLLFAHGNAENISSHFLSLVFVLESGYDFFIFDYRGYGLSAGEAGSPRKAIDDTIAAMLWAHDHAARMNVPFFVFAQSLGTAMSVRALAEEKQRIRPELLILDSPFLSFQWAAASILSSHWVSTAFQPLAFLLVSDEWAPREFIQHLPPAPVIILHGARDRMIASWLSEEVYRALPFPKDFLQSPTAGHIQTLQGQEGRPYREYLIRRLDQANRLFHSKRASVR